MTKVSEDLFPGTEVVGKMWEMEKGVKGEGSVQCSSEAHLKELV